MSLFFCLKGHTAHVFAEYLYSTIHHKKQKSKVERVQIFFAAFKDISIFMATKFVQQLREAICLCGWYTQALQRARTAAEQKFHDKPPKYRVGWRAYHPWTSGQSWFWKTSQQERKSLQMNPMAFPPHHFFQKDEAKQLLTREQVTLYWPCGLIIDSEHFTCR